MGRKSANKCTSKFPQGLPQVFNNPQQTPTRLARLARILARLNCPSAASQLPLSCPNKWSAAAAPQLPRSCPSAAPTSGLLLPHHLLRASGSASAFSEILVRLLFRTCSRAPHRPRSSTSALRDPARHEQQRLCLFRNTSKTTVHDRPRSSTSAFSEILVRLLFRTALAHQDALLDAATSPSEPRATKPRHCA